MLDLIINGATLIFSVALFGLGQWDLWKHNGNRVQGLMLIALSVLLFGTLR